jgi:hypothetical protein
MLVVFELMFVVVVVFVVVDDGVVLYVEMLHVDCVYHPFL